MCYGTELVFGKPGVTDLQGLAAAYDSNGDGKLDASDKDFAKFGIWHDANGNGVTDPGEFRSLIDEGIVSIALVSDGKAYTAANGEVQVRGEAIYTRADGSTGKLADAAFATNFASEQQRAAAAAGSTGLSAAMLAAGLIAAPLAAEPVSPSPAKEVPVFAAAMTATAETHPASDIHQSDRASVLTHELWTSPAEARISENSDEHGRFHDERSVTDHASGLEAPDSDRSLVSLADADNKDPAQTPAPALGDAHSVDQVQMVLPEQAAPDPADTRTADSAVGTVHVSSLATAALQGPEVDLDALLGPQPEARPLPQIALLGDAGSGAFGEMSGPMGHAFMIGLADQHVAAQLEQAAAAGHA
ncbi:hypothetical protein [Sphingopyxis sp.]|uniref:hypothetical protein n=1 Tax=Sphingopyxis sp. TaxID=1908224 RepID=UPI003BAA0F82